MDERMKHQTNHLRLINSKDEDKDIYTFCCILVSLNIMTKHLIYNEASDIYLDRCFQ